MEYDQSMYEVINLGNNRTVSLQEMIAGLERVFRVKAIVDRHPEQPGDVPQTWARVEKARALLGYSPQTPFAQGLEQFAQWLNNSTSAGVTS
jgi:UDP-glucuronate 4-epimerase